MKKNLNSLLSFPNNYEVFGPDTTPVEGITQDSKKVKKDFLFVAVRGKSLDGHDFIDEAIGKGASVVVGETELGKVRLKGNLKGKKVTYVRVGDSRKALGVIASSFYGNPSRKLKVIGVTGTDGKTTTSHIIHHLLNSAGKKAGLVSTVAAVIDGRQVETGLHVTSPDPVMLQELLSRMVRKNLGYAVVEVTSHGIDQDRIAGVSFDAGVLTNISSEHLDYHGTFDNYRDTKVRFLKDCPRTAVNKDDPSYGFIKEKLGDSAVDYSVKSEADVYTRDIKTGGSSTSFTLVRGGEEARLETSLAGEYNVSNVLAASCAAGFYGVGIADIKAALQSFKLPRGRMEEIDGGQDFRVIVDFAHTPNALEKVLLHLKGGGKGKLIAVVGSAGERDKEKRKKMGGICARYADLCVFTAEDPRSESADGIIEEMAIGARKDGGGKFVKIPERGEAVAHALLSAGKNDTVVICGKGHEKSMAYGKVEHPWSDREAAVNVLKSRSDVSAVVLAAGVGRRMNSEIPKVLMKIAERPMLAYTLENLRAAKIKDIVVVVGYKRELLEEAVGGAVSFAVQDNPKGGTGDATKAGLAEVSPESRYVMILYGDDSAFYKPDTISKVIETHIQTKSAITFVTLIKDDPAGLGRIVRDSGGGLVAIVEEKDASEKERKINEVNDGLYVFDKSWLVRNIPKVRRSRVTGEYYIVDLIKIALKMKEKVEVFRLEDDSQWQGANTPQQLDEADGKMRKLLEKGSV